MAPILPPTEGVSNPPDFEMYLQGADDGSVQIICDSPSCMMKGERTEHNPDGLWLQDVAALPYRPNPSQVTEAWSRHLIAHHSGGAA